MTYAEVEKFLLRSRCKLTLVSSNRQFLASVSQGKYSVGSHGAKNLEDAILGAIAEAKVFLGEAKN